MPTKPPLTIERILGWAHAHYARTGSWPSKNSGTVAGESWYAINSALYAGLRGLPGGTTLTRLLTVHFRLDKEQVRTIDEVLACADAYFRQNGDWPTPGSGPIQGFPRDSWKLVNGALFRGTRGWPYRGSLTKLLVERRGLRHRRHLRRLSIKQILSWADEYHSQTGRWPYRHAGPIPGVPGETWMRIDLALNRGIRALPRTSLAKLIFKHRGEHNLRRPQRLTPRLILAWADAYYRRMGNWPRCDSGPIPDSNGETWSKVYYASYQGKRGLPLGLTVPRILQKYRKVPLWRHTPCHLTHRQILGWADEHHHQTGKWPEKLSGVVHAAPGETWIGINGALERGTRGLARGMSVARLLAKRRGIRNPKDLPRLTIKQILAWVDDHFRRHARWPKEEGGPVRGAAGETWSTINGALLRGSRGLPHARLTLPKLLAKYRGVRNHYGLPRLTTSQILIWADRHHRRTGRWPQKSSGAVRGARGEKWSAIDAALWNEVRGLRGRITLAGLLFQHRRVRSRFNLPQLSSRQILKWIDEYGEHHGRWPTTESGSVKGVPGEKWRSIDYALRKGTRGLSGGSSLAKFLNKYRRVAKWAKKGYQSQYLSVNPRE